MPRKPNPNGPKWNFYIERDAVYKHQYVKASYCKWVPELKQPRTAARVHVGRLNDDGSVRPGKTFLEKFPEFQGKELFYFNNQLLDREGYLAANPDAQQQWKALEESKPEPTKSTKELIEQDWRAVSRQCGPTYAAWTHLKTSGMLDDLQKTFGVDDGLLLAALAVYAMCMPGAAMENFETWLGGVYLAQAKPVSGQRISELLSRVSRDKTDLYFKQRFDSLLETTRRERLKRAQTDPRAADEPLTVAFDSTSIPTYSQSVLDAEYGKAKSNAELKQVNLSVVCDQNTGEALFAREYAGSINDVASFSRIFEDMKAVGFHTEDVELVTDRGYKSPYNTKAQIDAGVKFVQGLRIDDGCTKKKFDKHMGELRGLNYYNSELGCTVVSLSPEEGEIWTRKTAAGEISVRLKTHLYYLAEKALDSRNLLMGKVDAIIKAKNNGRRVDAEDWLKLSKCVANIGTKDEPHYVRNMQEIHERLRYAGCFAIRTNYRHDPVQALRIYRKRSKIESQYRIFKSQIEGDRLRATETAYYGKLFVYILAMSLRSRLGETLRRVAEQKNKKVPNNSLETVLTELLKVTIHRRKGALCWRPDMLTKKQREFFSLLEVDPPAGIFRN